MRLVDQWAARAIVAFLDPKKEPSLKERVGWARFLYSMIICTPEHIERIRARSPKFKVTSPPQALLPTLINCKLVVAHIVQKMTWHAIDFSDSGLRLLTSDRPLIMSNGLSGDDAHIALPISPTRLYSSLGVVLLRRALSPTFPAGEMVFFRLACSTADCHL
jgi:hypothetical protein